MKIILKIIFLLIPFLEDDMDVEDFGNWNPESIPLLQRTIDQARSLGVKRTISWMAGESFFVELEKKKLLFEKLNIFRNTYHARASRR